jgi:sorting nexin-4
MADQFSNVSWQNDPRSTTSRKITSSSLDGREVAGSSNVNGMRQGVGSGAQPREGITDPLDLAGIGDGVLECTVTAPIKENDGTKDVFVSYLVTTHVCAALRLPWSLLMVFADYISFFCEANDYS